MEKTALITGASRGIGRACAIALAREGYNIAINYLNSREKAESLAEQLRAEGTRAIAAQADVSDADAVAAMCERIASEIGEITLLVNNAGIAQQALFCDITPQDWQRMFDVTVTGAYNCIRAVLPRMIARKSGRIINMSSVWGITGASCEVHYSAAKAALIGLTKALAKEVGPSGITVNCVAPGVIMTGMCAALTDETREALAEETPLGVLGRPEQIAKTVSFLAGEGGDFITGQVISPNGGFLI